MPRRRDNSACGTPANTDASATGPSLPVVDERYAGWNEKLGKDILAGKLSLADLSDRALADKLDPKPRSGRQELLETMVNRYL